MKIFYGYYYFPGLFGKSGCFNKGDIISLRSFLCLFRSSLSFDMLCLYSILLVIFESNWIIVIICQVSMDISEKLARII